MILIKLKIMKFSLRRKIILNKSNKFLKIAAKKKTLWINKKIVIYLILEEKVIIRINKTGFNLQKKKRISSK